jgi:uncharacterized damage-inducible protein DinB
MNLTGQIAKHLREVHFGGNWTWSYLKEHLEGVSWEEATEQVYAFNTIATLVYHMSYYLNAVFNRVQGKLLDAKHELSFEHPPIASQKDWEELLDKTWTDAESFARFIEQMPESQLWENISDKYGNYYRNIAGVIEHNHYHLGQIVLLKKILAAMPKEK